MLFVQPFRESKKTNTCMNDKIVFRPEVLEQSGEERKVKKKLVQNGALGISLQIYPDGILLACYSKIIESCLVLDICEKILRTKAFYYSRIF